LEQFHFSNNMSGSKGAKAIAAMLSAPNLQQLKDLRFSGTRALAAGSFAVENPSF
jgi:hypothetical protein